MKAQLIKKGGVEDQRAADRQANLQRMRLKASKNREDGMMKPKTSMDVSKMVRTRLTAEEALTYRTV
jgi:hypothetical protein